MISYIFFRAKRGFQKSYIFLSYIFLKHLVVRWMDGLVHYNTPRAARRRKNDKSVVIPCEIAQKIYKIHAYSFFSARCARARGSCETVLPLRWQTTNQLSSLPTCWSMSARRPRRCAETNVVCKRRECSVPICRKFPAIADAHHRQPVEI